MIVKILGSGCSNCKRLEALAREAAAQSGLSPTFEKVTGIADIMAYGVMHTPALVIDDQVVVSGRIPSKGELVGLLKEAGSFPSRGSTDQPGGLHATRRAVSLS